MVRDDERNAVVAVNLAAKLTDRQLRLQQRLRGERAERDDDLWPNELELTHQVRAARFDFLRIRVAIPGRSMLEDVADEDVLAAQVNGGENLRQELTGRTHESVTALVLVFSGRFTNAHELRGRTALAWHRFRSRLV